jgi:hypothetical protein
MAEYHASDHPQTLTIGLEFEDADAQHPDPAIPGVAARLPGAGVLPPR